MSTNHRKSHHLLLHNIKFAENILDTDFCLAKDESNSPAENLGVSNLTFAKMFVCGIMADYSLSQQVVFGERIRPSPYKIKFLENQTCSVLCTKFYKAGESESDRKLMIMKKGMNTHENNTS